MSRRWMCIHTSTSLNAERNCGESNSNVLVHSWVDVEKNRKKSVSWKSSSSKQHSVMGTSHNWFPGTQGRMSQSVCVFSELILRIVSILCSWIEEFFFWLVTLPGCWWDVKKKKKLDKDSLTFEYLLTLTSFEINDSGTENDRELYINQAVRTNRRAIDKKPYWNLFVIYDIRMGYKIKLFFHWWVHSNAKIINKMQD